MDAEKSLVHANQKLANKRLTIQLYDALENLICQLYADGPTKSGEERAARALAHFEKEFGERHDGKWKINL